MVPKVITSTANQIVKDLYALRKRPDRDERGLFLIEGYRPVSRAQSCGFTFETLYYSPELYLGSNEQALVDKIAASGTPVVRLSPEALAKAAYRDRPEGLLAVGRQWHTRLDELTLPSNPFVIVVESIEKPGNLGTILRSADATGADAVIVCDPVTDLFNPNVVRSSTGVMFQVPTVVATSTDTIAYLKDHHINTVGAIVQAAQNYSDADYTKPTAIVMGSEQFGLSDIWQKACDTPVRLPMLGLADSLNVAAATVVLAYEVVRQRQNTHQKASK